MAIPITKKNIEAAQHYLRRAVMEGWPVEHLVVPAQAHADNQPLSVRPGHVPEAHSQEARDLAAHRAGMHTQLTPTGPDPKDVLTVGQYQFNLVLLPPTKTLTETRTKLRALTAAERLFLVERHGPEEFLALVAAQKTGDLRALARKIAAELQAASVRPPALPPQQQPQPTKVTINGRTTTAPPLPVRPSDPASKQPWESELIGPILPPLGPAPSDWFKAPIGRIPDLVTGTPSQSTIEEKLWDLLPPLNARQLMCPCCHKQMKVGLTVLVNSQLGLFSLHCCFGSANLTSISREDLDDNKKPSMAVINLAIDQLRSRYSYEV